MLLPLMQNTGTRTMCITLDNTAQIAMESPMLSPISKMLMNNTDSFFEQIEQVCLWHCVIVSLCFTSCARYFTQDDDLDLGTWGSLDLDDLLADTPQTEQTNMYSKLFIDKPVSFYFFVTVHVYVYVIISIYLLFSL